MKPRIEIVWNHRRPVDVTGDGPDKRTLELRVTYGRIPRYFATEGSTRLTLEEFNNKNLKVHKVAFEEARSSFDIAVDIIRKLGDNFSFEQFSRDYRRILRHKVGDIYDVKNIFEEYLSYSSKIRPLAEKTKTTYRTTLNWLLKFNANMTIEEITTETIAKLDVFMHKQRPDFSKNTISIYFRCIRAVYNYSVAKGYLEDKRPFKRFPLTSSRKVNYGLSHESMKKILAYSGSNTKAQFGRDMFVLSFLLNGHYMSDILRIKNKNISKTEDGWLLQFIRFKTKQHSVPVSVLVTDMAMDIIKKYGNVNLSHPNDYIFPYLSNAFTEKQVNDRIHDVNHRANSGLSIVADELELVHFTMAQARHTYATLSCESGRPLADIQMDMGHTNCITTQGYINSLRTASMKKSKEMKEKLLKEIS